MPNPTFVPIIGSGFDAVADQQFRWAQFNRAADESNLARAAAADQTRNAYLFHVAQMDREDAARADLQAQREVTQAIANQTESRRDAEGRRQFDISAKLKEAELDSKKRQFDFQQSERNRLESEQKAVHGNYASAMVDSVRESGTALDSAKEEHDSALKEFNSLPSHWQSKLGDKVIFNARTGKFEPAIHGGKIPDDKVELVAQANAEMDDAKSRYVTARLRYDEASKDWLGLQRSLQQNSLVVKGRGGGAQIYSSLLDKTYGAAPAKAKAEDQTVEAWQPMPEAFRAPTPQEIAIGSPFGVPITTENLPAAFSFGIHEHPVDSPVADVSADGVRVEPEAPNPPSLPIVLKSAPPLTTNPLLSERTPFDAPVNLGETGPARVVFGREEEPGSYRPGSASFEDKRFPSDYPAAPKDKNLRVDGKVYMTPIGLARWVAGEQKWIKQDVVGMWMDRNIGAPVSNVVHRALFPSPEDNRGPDPWQGKLIK